VEAWYLRVEGDELVEHRYLEVGEIQYGRMGFEH
jgi:hypothetical protein